MLIYVAHRYCGDPQNLERAKQITHDLQINDLQNCYICPILAFSHIGRGEIGFDAEMALCLDILSVCDVLLLASEPSEGVNMEIKFANLVGMEVRRLEN